MDKSGEERVSRRKRDVSVERDFQNAPVPLTISRLRNKQTNKQNKIEASALRSGRDTGRWRIN